MFVAAQEHNSTNKINKKAKVVIQLWLNISQDRTKKASSIYNNKVVFIFVQFFYQIFPYGIFFFSFCSNYIMFVVIKIRVLGLADTFPKNCGRPFCKDMILNQVLG